LALHVTLVYAIIFLLTVLSHQFLHYHWRL